MISFGSARRLIVALVFVGAAAIPVAASAASFSAKTPAASATVLTLRPVIKVAVFDAQGVRGSTSYGVRVDGKSVACSITYKRHGNYTRFTLSGTPRADSSPGPHRVQAWVRDGQGHVTSCTWAFSVAPLPVPTTTSDMRISYDRTASIHLFAAMAPPAGSIRAVHDGSSIAHTYYSLDRAPAIEATLITVVQTDCVPAVHSLSYWSVTRSGVVEKPVLRTFTVLGPVDDQDPETSVSLTGSSIGEGAYEGTVTVHFTAVDPAPGSGVGATLYSFDDGVYSERVVGDLVIPAPTSGSATYTLRYYSVDRIGHFEPPHSVTFTVTAVPVITTTSDVQGAYVGEATVTLTPHSTGAGTLRAYYSVDGGPVTEGSAVRVSPPDHGNVMLALEFWSADEAGHVQSPHRTVDFLVESPENPDTAATHLVTGACISSECHLSDARTIHAKVVIPGTTYCATCHAAGVQPTKDCSRSDCHPNGMD